MIMTEQDIKDLKEIKDNEELLDIVEKIIKLEHQMKFPDRNGMIEALRDAQNIAISEITQNMQQNGAVCRRSWDSITNQELYSMLPQYKQGLINHGFAKIGKGAFEKLMEEYSKQKSMY